MEHPVERFVNEESTIVCLVNDRTLDGCNCRCKPYVKIAGVLRLLYLRIITPYHFLDNFASSLHSAKSWQ